MGSGRDKRKKAKGHVPGKGTEKTDRKTEQNAEKASRRLAAKAAGGEDDIDALLAAFKLEEEQHVTIEIIKDCDPPGPRVYSSFIPTTDSNKIIMYGGEWYDSDKDKVYVYGDIYVYNVDKNNWTKVISPGGPLPRTSHQAIIHKNYMYIFGGEFTSLNQKTFKHYSDLWRLDLTHWTWEQLPSKGGPSARSGHRIVLYKNAIILFGGFYDAAKETRYYNDYWAFYIDELKWSCLGPKPGQQASAPTPRGGCQLALHPDQPLLFVFGGYSVKYLDNTKNNTKGGSSSRKKGKGGGDDDGDGGGGGGEDGGKGTIHDDIWVLDLTSLHWERVKKAGMAPTPRTSFSLVTHKKSTVLFGGIFDREGAGDRLYSTLYNDAFRFNMDSRRWFPLVINPPKKQNKKIQAEESEGGGGGTIGTIDKSSTQEVGLVSSSQNATAVLQRAATKIQAHYRGYRIRKAFETYRLGGEISELLYSPAAHGIDWSSVDQIKPRARSAAMCAVAKNNVMWMFGGTVEISHTDIVLDDLWCLDLNKLNGWTCLQENTAGEEVFRELSDGEWEETDGEEEEGGEGDGK